jgi:hypothetical protein
MMLYTLIAEVKEYLEEVRQEKRKRNGKRKAPPYHCGETR